MISPITSPPRSLPNIGPVKYQLVEAIDRLDEKDGWSLQDRACTLMALRLTDHTFNAFASSPMRKTWQEKVAAPDTEGQVSFDYLKRLNGPTRRQSERNDFLDAVWNRAPELHVGSFEAGGVQALRYAAGLATPPKSLTFDNFSAGFLIELGRWQTLKLLRIKELDYEEELDTTYFEGLFHRHDIESFELYRCPVEHPHFFDGFLSSSISSLLIVPYAFIEIADRTVNMMPNLRELTLIIDEHTYLGDREGAWPSPREGDLFRIGESIGKVVVDQLTLRWKWDDDESEPRPPQDAPSQIFLPVIPPGHIGRLIFEGFPSVLLQAFLERSPSTALANVPSVVIKELSEEGSGGEHG